MTDQATEPGETSLHRDDPLHEQEIVHLEDRALADVIDDLASGAVLVTAPDERRLDGVAATGPDWFGTASPAVPDGAEVYRGPQDDLSGLDDDFDTVIQYLPPMGGYQRATAFVEAMALCKPGGIFGTVTGLDDTAPSDHDASYWVPHTRRGSLDAIHVVRWRDFATPRVLSVFRKDGGVAPEAPR